MPSTPVIATASRVGSMSVCENVMVGTAMARRSLYQFGKDLPRSATGRAEVLVAGKRYPILARIAMDQFVIDVGNDEVNAGDLVTIFGDPAAGVPSADDLAAAADTINYEIVTRMGGRFCVSYLGAID